MNERLKQKLARAKQIQEYHLQQSRKSFLHGGGQRLKAQTTRAAKQQCKRLFPLGCLIKGYHTVVNIDLTDPYPECIYECVIVPQGSRFPGGRSAFSNREETHKLWHGVKGRPHVYVK